MADDDEAAALRASSGSGLTEWDEEEDDGTCLDSSLLTLNPDPYAPRWRLWSGLMTGLRSATRHRCQQFVGVFDKIR